MVPFSHGRIGSAPLEATGVEHTSLQELLKYAMEIIPEERSVETNG